MTSLEISDFTQILDYVISRESYKCNVFLCFAHVCFLIRRQQLFEMNLKIVMWLHFFV